MGLRFFKPSVTSCPGCGRTNSQDFILLADQVRTFIDQKINIWKPLYPGVEKLVIAVMGCIVNGPGESKHADIGISLPGNNENPIAPVYIQGQLTHKLTGNNLAEQFTTILENYLQKTFKPV
jgi:(E)-4-hydroxy-3-methylbut-2-enyl-diphosphate synthase